MGLMMLGFVPQQLADLQGELLPLRCRLVLVVLGSRVLGLPGAGPGVVEVLVRESGQAGFAVQVEQLVEILAVNGHVQARLWVEAERQPEAYLSG